MIRPCVCLLMLLASLPGEAKDKKARAVLKNAQDEIEVVGQITPGGQPVTQFLLTQHHSSYYLYIEHAAEKSVTIIDVTKVAHPVLIGEGRIPCDRLASLYAVAGTSAIVMEGEGRAGAAVAAQPKTVRIVNYSDPQHPAVVKSFDGVTATGHDSRRGLIFIANGDGIWILRQNFAVDPAADKAYADRVLYDR